MAILDDNAKESLANVFMNFNSAIMSLNISLLFLYHKLFNNMFPYLML